MCNNVMVGSLILLPCNIPENIGIFYNYSYWIIWNQLWLKEENLSTIIRVNSSRRDGSMSSM